MEKMGVKIFSVFEQGTGPNERNDIVFTKSEVTIAQVKTDWRSPTLEHMKGISKDHFGLARFESDTDPPFVDLCNWLGDIFGGLVDRDITWDMQLFPLSAHPSILHNSLINFNWEDMVAFVGPQYRDKWLHFPANHETRVMVSQGRV